MEWSTAKASGKKVYCTQRKKVACDFQSKNEIENEEMPKTKTLVVWHRFHFHFNLNFVNWFMLSSHSYASSFGILCGNISAMTKPT